MEKLPASVGWLWVKEGYTLFRKQPFELSTLFLSYMFLMFALSLLPKLGQLLQVILAPVFSMAFMQACVHVEQKKRVYPNLLLVGFRSPAFVKLVIVGMLYLLAAIAALGLSTLIDGGVLWKVMTGQMVLDQKVARDSNMSLAMLLAGVVYTPAAMAFWYAAPLVMWQEMGVGKALFYSFFAALKAVKAFLLYGLVWMGIGVLLPTLVFTILGLFFNPSLLTAIVWLPLSIVLVIVMYCSFYPAYTSIFGNTSKNSAVEEQ
jgi:hypothetical protein